jgi:D-alanine-D-alanine ligase
VKITQADLARIAVITEQINTELGQELFVKPICGGSSVGVGYAANESKFVELLEALLKQHDSVMVEEFIRGKEATVAVLEGYRQQTEYILPVVEIVPPPEDPFFSYENKYNGLTNEICPGRFSYHQKSKLEDAARIIHQTLNCRHYSRSDFIVTGEDIYFLELNTLPGLTSESLFPKAAQAVGLSYNELINHLVQSALKKQS